MFIGEYTHNLDAKIRIAIPAKFRKELGESAVVSHKAIGAEVARLKIDYLIAIGPLMVHTAQEAIKLGMKKDRVFDVNNVREAADILEKIVKKGDLVYLKGSLLRHLERILIILENRQVGCQLVTCHRYQNCNTCPEIIKVIR